MAHLEHDGFCPMKCKVISQIGKPQDFQKKESLFLLAWDYDNSCAIFERRVKQFSGTVSPN